MKVRYLVIAIAIALIGLPADAHNPKSSNGGRIVSAGPYHVELVATGKPAEIFLKGHDDKPIDPKGFKGVAILNLGGKAARIALTPSEREALSGTAAEVLPENPKRGGSAHRAGWHDFDCAVRLIGRQRPD